MKSKSASDTPARPRVARFARPNSTGGLARRLWSERRIDVRLGYDVAYVTKFDILNMTPRLSGHISISVWFSFCAQVSSMES